MPNLNDSTVRMSIDDALDAGLVTRADVCGATTVYDLFISHDHSLLISCGEFDDWSYRLHFNPNVSGDGLTLWGNDFRSPEEAFEAACTVRRLVDWFETT